MIYLDHAATSYPKPSLAIEAVSKSFTEAGGNPGRSGHQQALAASRIIADARMRLAGFFGIADAHRVILTGGGTEGLNILAKCVQPTPKTFVTTNIEHNSYARPLRKRVRRDGGTLNIVEADALGRIDPQKLSDLYQARGPLTVWMTACSNVLGSIQPIQQIREAIGADSLLLLDAAQIAGHVDPALWQPFCDGFAAPAHKSLLSPQGTGLLYLREGIACDSLLEGGTGSKSELPDQPTQWPDAMESGTPNTPGFAGVIAAIDWLSQKDGELQRWQHFAVHEKKLWVVLHQKLTALAGVRVISESDPMRSAPLVSFVVDDAIKLNDAAEIAFELDQRYHVAVRPGLHCAPDAHRTADSFPNGAVRLSLGYNSTMGDVDAAVDALQSLLSSS